MPRLPLRFIPIGVILGDHEAAESLALPVVYSAGGSRNVYLDKYGRARVIGGYTKRNAAAVTSAVGGVAMRLRALYHYGRQQAGGAVTRRLIGVFDSGPGGTHYELRVSTDGGLTWNAPLRDFGVSHVGRIPDFAQIGNALVIAFGVNQAQSYDGVTLTDATTSQNAAPTAVVHGTGLLDGTYRARIVVIRADGSRKAASLPSVATVAAKQKITWTWAADTDAVSYEIYRTTGTGAVYFYEGNVAAGTLSFVSLSSDLQLIAGRVLQEYGDPPPDGIAFCESHAERIFYGRSVVFPRRWWYSDPGLPYSVNREAAFLDMTDEESFTDVSVGGTGGFKGMFVAWLERSVWTVSGKGRYSGAIIDFERRRTDAQTGTVSHRTVARIPKGSAYVDARGQTIVLGEAMLAYLTPLGDLRVFDGNNDTIVSWAKQDVFRRLSYAGRSTAFQITDVERNEVTWIFPIDGAVEPNYAVSWNLRAGTMVERQWPFACGVAIDAPDKGQLLLAGEASLATGGFAYLLWDGQTFDGTAITGRIATKTLYGRDRNGQELIQFTKRWRWADLLVWSDGQISLLVEWWAGEANPDTDAPFGSLTLTRTTSNLQTSDSSALQSSDASQLVAVTAPESIPRAQLTVVDATTGTPRFLHARGIKLRISSSSSRPWALVGLVLAYQVLPGLKREFRR